MAAEKNFENRVKKYLDEYGCWWLKYWGGAAYTKNSKGTMLLLRVQLIEYHDKYIRLGDIPSYAYENFMEMYDAYHALGGNGMITKMMHEIEELHLKKKEV